MFEFELLNRVLSDPLPQIKVDGLYLFCQTQDNESSVLESGVALYHLGITNKLFILGSPPMNGYPGFEHWRKYIMNHGVEENAIENITPLDEAQIHTLIEAKSLVQHALKNKYKHIILMSTGFHQIRAYLTAITAIKLNDANIAFYSQPGKPLDWEHTVSHSQGELVKTRKQLIQTEMERMLTYQKKGDLLPFKAGIDYLNERNKLINFPGS